jgi:hypothetical protein
MIFNSQRWKNVISTEHFFFDEYVAISHRYGLNISQISYMTALSPYVKIELFVKFVMHNSLLNFHSVFLRHPVH